ncbi:hypothetical protein SAMN06296386_10811 [Lachnospiraceae bacterium]|nr:hypothetical protein SAMN06296386_10811 [Lachnospiraceae bacterium]
MEELHKKLFTIPDTYFDSVIGIMSYAKKKPSMHISSSKASPAAGGALRFRISAPGASAFLCSLLPDMINS